MANMAANQLPGSGLGPRIIPQLPQSVRHPIPGVPLPTPIGSILPGHLHVPIGRGLPIMPHPPLPGSVVPGLIGQPPDPRMLLLPPPHSLVPPMFPMPSPRPVTPLLMTTLSSSITSQAPLNNNQPILATPTHISPTISLQKHLEQQHLNPPGIEGNNNDDDDVDVWVEHKTSNGNVYYSDPKTQKTTWEKPSGVKIVPFTPTGSLVGEGSIPPSIPTAPLSGLPPGISLVPQRVWSEHKNPDGKVYYYNKVTRQSVWDKPKDLELVMPLPAELAGTQTATPTTTESKITQEVPPVVNTESPTDIHKSSVPLLPTPPIPNLALLATVFPQPSLSLLNTLKQPQDVKPEQEEPMELDSKELLALVAAKLGTGPQTLPFNNKPNQTEEKKGPRPTLSVPIPGTPWSIVYTSDEKMFFFDATNRKSFWDIPPELENNSQVYKIIENPPWKKKRVGAVEEPASKRIKFNDDEGSKEEEMEVGGDVEKMGGTVSDTGGSKENSVVVKREVKMAELRTSLSLEERQETFKKMLLERQVSAFSTWDKELPKFVFDDRFHLLAPKERKIAFDEFISTRAEQEMKEKKLKIKLKKESFMKLLQEAKITTKTTFSEFARANSKDERFKDIEKMREREALFHERITELKKINKQKEEGQKQVMRNKVEKIKNEFLSMLSEESKLDASLQWRQVKGLFQKDTRYQAVESSSQREEFFNEYIKSLGRDEKQERIAASLREREREVHMSRTAQEKQWDKEKDQWKKSEAEENFKSLLVDLVRDPSASWNDMKRSLRRDHRWDMCELMEMNDKEKMFREHVGNLAEKRRGQFRNLLEETSKISLTMSWKKARKLIKEDPRYKKYSDSDHRREAEYDRYLRDKLILSKNEFRDLLKETKLITHKSKDLIRESERHLKNITEVLKNDKRYLILECIEPERKEILLDYIDELYKKGPPPPPTATHPSERIRK